MKDFVKKIIDLPESEAIFTHAKSITIDDDGFNYVCTLKLDAGNCWKPTEIFNSMVAKFVSVSLSQKQFDAELILVDKI